MKHKVLIFTAALLFTGSFAVAQSQNKDEAAFRSLIKQMTEAQLAYDPSALDKIFTPDYIEISPLGEVDPRAKVLGFYAPTEKAKVGDMTGSVNADEYTIRVYKNFAVVIARLNYTMTVDGKTLPPKSIRATFVCKKGNCGWKIASAQYTGIRPKT